jgi:SAM-dependent methyltransferase
VKVPDRVRWAVEVVHPGPADVIMEIGCGPGVAAALICEQLETGHLLAIDRSAVAVSRTTERNASHIRTGRLAVRESTVLGLEVSPGTFGKVFSVNVNLFWVNDPARELAVLRHAMKPGGTLHILYGDGPAGAGRGTPVIADALTAQGFIDVEVLKSEHGLGVSARSPERP